MLTKTNYEGFDYPADQLLKFLSVLDFFTIMLKDGQIVHFTPSSATTFKQWLLHHNVIDIGRESVAGNPPV